MSITHIQRLSLPVADQERAKHFYLTMLGFELVRDLPTPMGENARWLEVAPKEAATSMVLVTWLSQAPGSAQGIMLETTTIDEDCERLRQAGVIVEGPQTTPWGKQASFHDPDGNGLVLADPAPVGA
ncbi:glyoxalase [Ktedonosporobacter rubrisoli]|uniref:Glyoxalase n=1 Tax=Ktedonosporobacter rubrisoli TaxID=2509675 RepID=A0A4P6JQU2_KTERU|nr:VOC family protein [Ktedonosporobacter rubrisoli]QBD77532.1 glyoxalase [Ktedonosporobacter rubrisoli]